MVLELAVVAGIPLGVVGLLRLREAGPLPCIAAAAALGAFNFALASLVCRDYVRKFEVSRQEDFEPDGD